MAVIQKDISECISTTVVALSYAEIMSIIEQIGITPPDEGVEVNVNFEKANGTKIIIAPAFTDGDKINIEWKVAENTTDETSYTISDITLS